MHGANYKKSKGLWQIVWSWKVGHHHCTHINHIYLGIVSDHHCTHINHIYLGIVSDHHCTHINHIYLGIVSDYHCTHINHIFFFLIFFVGHIYMSYFGATDTPVLDFWLCLLWVSKPEWVLPYLYHRGECKEDFPRTTSGATRCWPLDGQHCRTSIRFISCLRILLWAAVSLKPTINRSWVLCTNHLAKRPNHIINHV